VYAAGRGLGDHLPAGPRRVVIGQDTRESSGWIADTLAAGLHDSGVETASAGVVPTPAIAHLTHTHSFSAGVVISASHNPWRDNGVKVFGHDGYKLPDEVELEIESEIFSLLNNSAAVPTDSALKPSLPGDSALRLDYLNWLARSVPGADRLRIVVDCANGAATTVAPDVFRRSGVHAEFTHCAPDGRNINEKCGALHPDVVAQEVVARKADLGICFDGDADRALFADSGGKVINGDAVMLLMARELQRRGELSNETVVATTMSNMGLEIALREASIKMLRAPVGDKYVLEEMRKTGAVLGGEQSGHIILSREATTGEDNVAGLLSAQHCASLAHLLQHIFIAHRRAQHFDGGFPQGDLQSHVGHGGGYHGFIGKFAAALELARHQEHDSIAIDHLAAAIGKSARSASPSKQMPRSAFRATTSWATTSGCRAPHFSLMLRPSGAQCVNSA